VTRGKFLSEERDLDCALGANGELVRMGRCKNCGVDMSPEETCVFATYKTNVGGREIIVCCPSCASDLEQAATQPAEPKPEQKAPARKAPKKKAPRKVKRAGKARKAAKKPKKAAARKKKAARKVKRPAKKPARKRRK